MQVHNSLHNDPRMYVHNCAITDTSVAPTITTTSAISTTAITAAVILLLLLLLLILYYFEYKTQILHTFLLLKN
jgi:hypothetical protein